MGKGKVNLLDRAAFMHEMTDKAGEMMDKAGRRVTIWKNSI